MILAIFFLLAAFYLGRRLALQFDFIDSRLKLEAFTVFAGLFFSTWIALLLFWLVFANLTYALVLSSAAICFAVGKALPSKPKKLKPDSKTALVTATLFIILLVFLQANSLFFNENGDLMSRGYVWNDGAAHLAFISSFAFGENHPPAYPFVPAFKLNYPMLIDFLSAILSVGGMRLAEAIVIPNILISFSLVVFIFFFAAEFSKKEWVGVLLLVLFLLQGNYGFAKALGDFSKGEFLPLNENYSHFPPDSLHFLNIITSMFVPERSLLLGFSALLLVFWILYRVFESENYASQKKELLFAGVVAGLMPFAYTHFFILAALFVFFWAMLNPRKEWLYFLVPFVLLALPQLAWINQPVVKGFFGFQPGWMHDNESKSIAEIAFFWAKNFPLAVLLAPIVFLLLSKTQRLFAIPFVLLFLLANMLRFQPQDWDNVKMIVFPFFMFALLAAIGMERIWNLKARKNAKSFLRIMVALIICVSILSGVLGVLWLGFTEYSKATLFPARDYAVAEWIKQNTPAKSMFIAGGESNNLVPSLAGRKVVMGFDGWAWSYGLEYWEFKQASERMFKQPSCGDFLKYGVDYVLYGPNEWIYTKDVSFFESNFGKVYDQTFDGRYNFKIYKVNC